MKRLVRRRERGGVPPIAWALVGAAVVGGAGLLFVNRGAPRSQASTGFPTEAELRATNTPRARVELGRLLWARFGEADRNLWTVGLSKDTTRETKERATREWIVASREGEEALRLWRRVANEGDTSAAADALAATDRAMTAMGGPNYTLETLIETRAKFETRLGSGG